MNIPQSAYIFLIFLNLLHSYYIILFINSSSGSNGNVVASPIKKVVTESNTKKTPQSSQSKSIGKNEKKRSTPSKETATKKTPKSSQTAKKKKKIEEVEATVCHNQLYYLNTFL